MITIKLPYKTSNSNKDMILSLLEQQNHAIKYLFNRMQDATETFSQKDLTRLTKKINNIPLIDSWFKQSSIYKAQSLYDVFNKKTKEIIEYNKKHPGIKEKLPSIIFGGKNLFNKRAEKKIKRSEFNLKKLMPLNSIGQRESYGNRKFRLRIIENNSVLFQPDRKTKITLDLPHLRKNYKKTLNILQDLAEDKKLPIQFELDLKFVYITYDEYFLQSPLFIPVLNRFMTIDLNPNYVGYSIIDWKSEAEKIILKTGIVSIKSINDNQKKTHETSDNLKNLYWNNKRKHEIFQISKMLTNLAKTYRVEIFGLEDLSIESCDKCRGKTFNRLVNNFWLQEKFASNLIKRLNIAGIKSVKLIAMYSSFIGNMLNRNQPDPVAASIEINRRLYKYLHREKPVIFPSFKVCKDALIKSLEETDKRLAKFLQDSKDWIDFYKRVKSSKLRYRATLDQFRYKVFRLNHGKSLVEYLTGFSII